MIRFASFDFDTRRAIAWGSTWAVAVAICESLAMAPERWVSGQLLLWWLIYWVMPVWCVIGALLLWLLNRGERRAGRRGMMPAFLLPIPLPLIVQPFCAVVMAGASARLFPKLHDFVAAEVNPLRLQILDIGVYNLWVYAFYGSLLVAVFTLTVRTERFRARVHASAMARSRTEGLLDAERLQALQAQIDPNLLLDSMRELEQRYRSAPQAAERLLEALVEFLRNAMHGLREPVSSLDAELRLARAFAQLQRERGAAGSWRIAHESLGDLGAAKFPSLLMLRLLALGGADGRPLLRIRAEANRAILQLVGRTENVWEELRQQVQARLRGLYGDAFSLEHSPLIPTQLAIVINVQ